MRKKGVILLVLIFVFLINTVLAVTTKDVIVIETFYINTTLYDKYHLTALYPYGITTNATETANPDTFYLTDQYNNAIWELNGTFENRTGKHSISSFSGNPEEIGTNGTDFWFNDKSNKKVYHLNSTFNNQSGLGLSSSDGLSVNSSNIFIQIYGKNYISVYDYSMNLLYNITCSILDTCYYARSVYQYNNQFFYIMYGGVTPGLNFLRRVDLDGTVSDIRYNITALGIVSPTDLTAFTMSDDSHFWIIKYDADGGKVYHVLLEDSDAPYFTLIPNNASLNYGENLSVTFHADDYVGIDYYSVNDTRFTINSSGILSNINTLAIGNYELNVTVNDSSNNINWTIYRVQINKSSEQCRVLFNETSPIEYSQTFRVWANCTSPFVLIRNGTTITNNSEQSLSPSAYNFSFLRNDSSNYTYFYNETQFRTIDTTKPILTIIHPGNGGEFTTSTIDLNFSAIDNGIGLDKCWYMNDTGNNKTINCTQNTTISQAIDGTYTIYLWANDSYGNIQTDHHVWTISANAPAINFIKPQDMNYSNNPIINFTFVANDSNGVDTCQLWSNTTGLWHKNQTLTSITSNVQTSFNLVNSVDGLFIWGLWCNDSTGLPGTSKWSSVNRTFIIDTVKPTPIINNITTTNGSQTISFSTNVSDFSPVACTYSIFNSTWGVDIYSNQSISCNQTSSATVSAYGTYTLVLFTQDQAGNLNSTMMNFTTSASTIIIITPGGGGGGEETTTLELSKNFSILTVNYQNRLDLSLVKDSVKSRKGNFILVNRGIKPLTVEIFCSVEGANKSSDNLDICKYVKLNQTKFTISPNEEEITLGEFYIVTPNVSLGDKYYFNLFATYKEDDKSYYSKLSVSSRVSFLSYVYKWSYIPRFLDDNQRIYPVWSVALPLSILLFFLIFMVLSKRNFQVLGFFMGILIFMISFYFLLWLL